MVSHSSSQNPNREIFKHVPEIDNDWIVLEGLMYQFWKPDTITAERKRIRQTWFDYRHIHPVLRSFVFVREYEAAHQRAYKRFYGVTVKPNGDLPRNAFKTLYRRSAQAITQTISRMHLIDELGCPYDSFFDAAFNHFMQERAFDEWKLKSKFLADMPLPPLNILADARSMVSSQKAFEQRNEYKLRLPKHPHYLAKNWAGTSNQKACSNWLIDTVKNRSGRNIALARLTYEAGLLRENEIVKSISLDTVKKMRVIRSEINSQ